MLLRVGNKAFTKWSFKLFSNPEHCNKNIKKLSGAHYAALVQSVILLKIVLIVVFMLRRILRLHERYLSFRREEADKKRQHELVIAQIFANTSQPQFPYRS